MNFEPASLGIGILIGLPIGSVCAHLLARAYVDRLSARLIVWRRERDCYKNAYEREIAKGDNVPEVPGFTALAALSTTGDGLGGSGVAGGDLETCGGCGRKASAGAIAMCPGVSCKYFSENRNRLLTPI